MTSAEILAALASPPWEESGRSVLGRPIVARAWPGVGPPVLLFGAIHGEEPLGAVCLLRLAAALDAAAAPPARTTWIAPAVNPDGLAAGRRHNQRGVDLNRNFPAASWRAGGDPEYHPGPAPASEPETAALMALIARAGARRLVALHSPYRTVNWDGPARALAERMGAANGYGATGDMGYPTPGSFGSLYGRDRQLEVVTLEIPPVDEEQAWRENRAALALALEE